MSIRFFVLWCFVWVACAQEYTYLTTLVSAGALRNLSEDSLRQYEPRLFPSRESADSFVIATWVDRLNMSGNGITLWQSARLTGESDSLTPEVELSGPAFSTFEEPSELYCEFSEYSFRATTANQTQLLYGSVCGFGQNFVQGVAYDSSEGSASFSRGTSPFLMHSDLFSDLSSLRDEEQALAVWNTEQASARIVARLLDYPAGATNLSFASAPVAVNTAPLEHVAGEVRARVSASGAYALVVAGNTGSAALGDVCIYFRTLDLSLPSAISPLSAELAYAGPSPNCYAVELHELAPDMFLLLYATIGSPPNDILALVLDCSTPSAPVLATPSPLQLSPTGPADLYSPYLVPIADVLLVFYVDDLSNQIAVRVFDASLLASNASGPALSPAGDAQPFAAASARLLDALALPSGRFALALGLSYRTQVTGGVAPLTVRLEAYNATDPTPLVYLADEEAEEGKVRVPAARVLCSAGESAVSLNVEVVALNGSVPGVVVGACAGNGSVNGSMNATDVFVFDVTTGLGGMVGTRTEVNAVLACMEAWASGESACLQEVHFTVSDAANRSAEPPVTWVWLVDVALGNATTPEATQSAPVVVHEGEVSAPLGEVISARAALYACARDDSLLSWSVVNATGGFVVENNGTEALANFTHSQLEDGSIAFRAEGDVTPTLTLELCDLAFPPGSARCTILVVEFDFTPTYNITFEHFAFTITQHTSITLTFGPTGDIYGYDNETDPLDLHFDVLSLSAGTISPSELLPFSSTNFTLTSTSYFEPPTITARLCHANRTACSAPLTAEVCWRVTNTTVTTSVAALTTALAGFTATAGGTGITSGTSTNSLTSTSGVSSSSSSSGWGSSSGGSVSGGSSTSATSGGEGSSSVVSGSSTSSGNASSIDSSSTSSDPSSSGKRDVVSASAQLSMFFF